jgi:hypothetical protein
MSLSQLSEFQTRRSKACNERDIENLRNDWLRTNYYIPFQKDVSN